MITIFDHTDEDGDRIVAHKAALDELCIEVFPTSDPGLGYSVFLPAAEARRLLDAVRQHWPTTEGA